MSQEAWAADWLYLAAGNFSYLSNIITGFTANPHITVYGKGMLIYGTEP